MDNGLDSHWGYMSCGQVPQCVWESVYIGNTMAREGL